jgi:1-aminocyclopropane-1-carboxylate deaminase/D-cysteine desulfhydrase-like pyridoxal-dependent ACC family enzyme
MKLVARTEALLLDPVYTGKAMAGLVHLIRSAYFTKNESVIFIHTGGTPGLFLDLIQTFD